MNLVADPPHFLTHFGVHWEQDASGMTGGALVDEQLCLPGTTTPRTGALAILADNAAGYVGAVALGTIAPTIDLSMHVFRTPTARTVDFTCGAMRAGRRVAVLETWFTAAGESEPYGVSIATFLATHAPDTPDPAVFEMPSHDDPPFTPASALDEPLDQHLGISAVAPGVLELPRRPHVSNGRGTVQGGILTLLMERACESALHDDGHVVTGIDVRYLSAVRAGPARAEAVALRDDDGGGHLWVTVVDGGDHDRLVAHALVTTRRAS